jgi:ribosomal protein S7
VKRINQKVTTETIAAPAFDIVKARGELETMQNELANLKTALENAVSNADMAEVLRIVPLQNELTKNVEKLAKKISRESGEEVVTAKVNAATAIKLWIAENVTRNEEFAVLVQEMKNLNPKFKAVNIDYTGDATNPDSINIVGGFRQTDPAKKGTTKRPRAQWYKDEFGTRINEESNTEEPASMSSREVILSFGSKYGMSQSYDSMTGNERQQLLVKIVEAEGLRNLARANQ